MTQVHRLGEKKQKGERNYTVERINKGETWIFQKTENSQVSGQISQEQKRAHVLEMKKEHKTTGN